MCVCVCVCTCTRITDSFAVWHGTAVQLTTFRPLASASKGAPSNAVASSSSAPSVTGVGSSGGNGAVTAKHKSRTLDSSDTSDYENLSSCTSGRYATLPPQSQFGGSGAYRDHYSTAAAPGIVFRPASAAPSFGGNGGGGHLAAAQGDASATAHTLSLHRPVKRSHWLNHNGRPSDVLARVFQANQDWLESNDPQDRGSSNNQAAVATIKDVRTSHRSGR